HMKSLSKNSRRKHHMHLILALTISCSELLELHWDMLPSRTPPPSVVNTKHYKDSECSTTKHLCHRMGQEDGRLHNEWLRCHSCSGHNNLLRLVVQLKWYIE
ncbi:MAG: hypothetical protein MRZ57_04240, partial [Bacteroidales bacterium]|nr:hypothetical protein [Bacteroidales bacterium]